jgi:hypothetical protein
MMVQDDSIAAIRAELVEAEKWRKSGKEGRARVCARRAAGWAIQFYIENRLEESTSLNAYQLLGWFRSRKEVPEALREAAKRLYVRVTPAGSLPHPNDPLQDAGAIIDAILQGQI